MVVLCDQVLQCLQLRGPYPQSCLEVFDVLSSPWWCLYCVVVGINLTPSKYTKYFEVFFLWIWNTEWVHEILESPVVSNTEGVDEAGTVRPHDRVEAHELVTIHLLVTWVVRVNPSSTNSFHHTWKMCTLTVIYIWADIFSFVSMNNVIQLIERNFVFLLWYIDPIYLIKRIKITF